MKKYAFGVDIGGTTCKIGFFETTGVLLDKWEIPTNTENAGEAILSDVARALKEKLTQESIDKEEVQGIGVGVPGAVTEYRTVHGCENLGWETVEVAEELMQLTGLQVKVENDANMAALGEMWKGSACGSKDVILVTLGTGVGAGVVCGGKILPGFHGAAGEIGHMTVNYEETEQCSCGKYGCLEQYASATGIVRLAKRRFASAAGVNGAREAETLTAKDIFDAAKSGTQEAIAIVDEVCKILGVALANVACVANPEVILFGGGVSKAGDILTENVKRYFDQYAYYACRDTKFGLASLGNDAGIWGCVRLVLEDV